MTESIKQQMPLVEENPYMEYLEQAKSDAARVKPESDDLLISYQAVRAHQEYIGKLLAQVRWSSIAEAFELGSKMQRSADAKWIEEQGLVRLPDVEQLQGERVPDYEEVKAFLKDIKFSKKRMAIEITAEQLVGWYKDFFEWKDKKEEISDD